MLLTDEDRPKLDELLREHGPALVQKLYAADPFEDEIIKNSTQY